MNQKTNLEAENRKEKRRLNFRNKSTTRDTKRLYFKNNDTLKLESGTGNWETLKLEQENRNYLQSQVLEMRNKETRGLANQEYITRNKEIGNSESTAR